MCALWHFRLGDRALDRLACGRRTARGQFLVALVADAGRRRGPPLFSVWDLEIGGGGALRQQPLATAGRRAAFGCARTLLDFGIGRARPLLKSARKGSRVYLCCAFPRAREGGASASGFDPAAPARSYGDCSARADRNRWPRGGCGVCALWHFRLGDRALDRLACGRRTARGQFLVAVVADAGRRRGPPPFSVWDLEIGGGGALRQQPLATAGRRAAFGCARTLLDFGIGRARPLLESARKGSRVTLCCAFPRAREGGASASGFDPAAPARSYGDCSARADRNRWPRGGCGVCALWHFRLGDRALDPLACGRRTARGQFLVALVADAGRRRGPPLFSVWDLEIGGGGALRQQPLATAGRRAAFGCARTLLDFGIGRARPLLESARKGSRVTLCCAFPRAREGGALGQRFRSGGAGAQLWGLFGASRSKPLAEGWLWRVCALAFQAG